MPPVVSLVGDVLVAVGLFINLIVFRENSFGGSTIETVEGQKVISTGPYALVRHPMYAGVLVMVTGIPLALGSWWGLLVVALAMPALIWRILDEEKLLKKDLQGYTEYAQKVRYRLYLICGKSVSQRTRCQRKLKVLTMDQTTVLSQSSSLSKMAAYSGRASATFLAILFLLHFLEPN
jgi:hypothetical protein